MNQDIPRALAAFLFACSVLCPPAALAQDRESKRPNILFAFADDWGRFASAYAGDGRHAGINDVIQTPNFDRVAREGVLFRNAFVTAPSCTPCRSSVVSGQYFWRTGRGAILQGAVWDPEIPAFPLLLKDAGYHIGKMYKVWSPGTPADAPYGGQQFAYKQAGARFNQFSQHVTQMAGQGKAIEAAKQELYGEVRANFDAFLADRNRDEPFCFWFGPTNVHRKWINGSGQALWGIDPDALQGKLPPFLPDVPEVRQDLADYLGEAQAFDAGLGVLLARLEELGELENTLVVVSGDHGAPGFPRGKCNLYDFGTNVSLAIRGPGVPGGRIVDDFVNLTDLAPTFLEFAGVPRAEVMTGQSLVPVLSSAKEGQVDPNRSWVVTGRERHVAAAREEFLPYPQRAIRTADSLYIVNFRPDRWPLGTPLALEGDASPSEEALTENTFATLMDEDAGPTKAWLVRHRNDPRWRPYFERAYGKRPREELYDLSTDPQQMKNVAADPAHADAKKQLNRQLMEELERTGDPRLIGDGEYFENPPLSGPVENPQPRPGRLRR